MAEIAQRPPAGSEPRPGTPPSPPGKLPPPDPRVRYLRLRKRFVVRAPCHSPRGPSGWRTATWGRRNRDAAVGCRYGCSGWRGWGILSSK